MKSQPGYLAVVNEEMEFRALLDSANDLIFILSPDARFLYSNNALQSALGYSESELRTLTIFDLLHPSCLQKCRQHFQDRMHDPRQGTLETEFVTKDGRSIAVEGNCSCGGGNGQPGAIRGIFRDITERERAQEDLRKSEERFRSLIEHSHDAISLFGPDGAVLYVSPSTTNILGYLPEDLRDRAALEFVRPDFCHYYSWKLPLAQAEVQVPVEKSPVELARTAKARTGRARSQTTRGAIFPGSFHRRSRR